MSRAAQPVRIHPSILSADFTELGAEIARVPSADAIHVDVMDGHFVPNLTLGLPVVEALARRAEAELDVHLMIADPDRWAPAYAEAGAQSVTFHAEAAAAPVRLARELRARGSRAGLALNPATSLEPVLPLLDEIDSLLVMSVEPGFGGQAFLDLVLPKVRAARAAVDGSGAPVAVQVDGGITTDTILRAAEAGADMFVAGSAVFGADDPEAAVQALRRAAAGR